MINVLLVDDHELVRTGIRRLLEDAGGIQVAGECASGEEAVRAVSRLPVDVVLMDLNMPGIGGLEATRRIRLAQEAPQVIVLTVVADEPYPTRLIEVGASGYLTKDCGIDEMVRAINTVHQGRRYLDPEVAQRIAMASLPGESANPFERLSSRELQVLLMLTEGESIQSISDKLCLSPKTVSTYRHRLQEKLGVDNDMELMRLAIQHGVVQAPLSRC